MTEQTNTIQYEHAFSLERFEQVLEQITNRASACEHDPNGPEQEFKWLRDCGALQIVLPGELLDFNQPNTPLLLKLLKDLGQANLSVGRIFEGHINTLYLIHLYATEEQRNQWYTGVIESDHLFGIWNTQDQDALHFITTENGLELKGSKTFCSGCTLVNRALVTGNIKSADRDGWQMSIINMSNIASEDIDRESWQPLGMKASGSFKVNFSGYILEEMEFLGQPGIYLNQPYFNAGAIRFAAVHLGGAEAILQGTIKYLYSLGRTGDVFQQLRLSDMTSALISGRLWLAQAGKYYDTWIDEGGHDDELIAFANMTRVNIEEICLKVMDLSNRSVGARGLMDQYPLGRIFRDLTFYLRQPAPDATRLKIAEFFLKQSNAFND